MLVNRFGLKRSEQPRGCLLEHDKAAGVTIRVRLSVPWSSVLPDESAGRDPASRRRVLRRFVPPQVCIFLSFFFLFLFAALEYASLIIVFCHGHRTHQLSGYTKKQRHHIVVFQFINCQPWRVNVIMPKWRRGRHRQSFKPYGRRRLPCAGCGPAP